MELNVFSTEQWMTDHEGSAIFNLTDTCVRPLMLSELQAMDHDHLLDHITMDYGTIAGDPRLRKEISALYENADIDNITLANGCNEANKLVIETLLEKGDRVITFTPGYQLFTSYPESMGCCVTALKLYEEKGWLPDETELGKAFEQPVKLVILNQPNNPTGTVFPLALQDKLVVLCRKWNAWLLVDEVYPTPQLPSVSDSYAYGISTASLSKTMGLAGLRLGWIKGPEDLIHAINYRRDYSLISTGPLIDTLGLVAMQNREFLQKRADSIISRARQAVSEWLETENKCSLIMPKTGTVSFLRYDADIPSAELCEQLQEQYGVFFVPGSCFGCEHHVRLSFTKDPEYMKEGLQRFSQYLRESGK